VAAKTANAGIDADFTTPWEPGLRDGPTSARFAVVDYDSTRNVLTPPAIWDRKRNCYVAPDGKTVLDAKQKNLYQYHQLSVWAIVQNTLDFFESSFALGRRISWAFEGNRLLIVPHAGYGENAYYDRASKSLQLYWFDDASGKGKVYTCLSSDIVNHEFGHAVLDGLRPYYYESVNAQTAAFHEFLGDLTAILMALRNSAFRRIVLKESNGKLTGSQLLAGLAQQFARATEDAPYLRSGLNKETMKSRADNLEPHALLEVLTGAMFDILMGVFAKHQKNEVKRAKAGGSQKPSDIRALADTVPRMQMLAIQPLDLLPPCAVTFRDYALAVLRSEHINNPTDPAGYRRLMIESFIKRGILKLSDRNPLLEPAPVFTVRPFCRGTDDHALWRDPRTRSERQLGPLGAQARYFRRGRLESRARRTDRRHQAAHGASGYDRGARRSGHDRRNHRRRARPARTGVAAVHCPTCRRDSPLRPGASLLTCRRYTARRHRRPPMADKLLIRVFDVGLGDCIYCRIPKAHKDGRDFHILIDCGTLSSTEYLSNAITCLKPLLPTIDGKRHVDLLVVTHEHKITWQVSA
jgi:hypothetical protein